MCYLYIRVYTRVRTCSFSQQARKQHGIASHQYMVQLAKYSLFPDNAYEHSSSVICTKLMPGMTDIMLPP